MFPVKTSTKLHNYYKKNKSKKISSPNDMPFAEQKNDTVVLTPQTMVQASTDAKVEETVVIEVSQEDAIKSSYQVVADAGTEVLNDTSADETPEISGVSSATATTASNASVAGVGSMLGNTGMIAFLGGGLVAVAAVAGAGGGGSSAGISGGIAPIQYIPVTGNVFSGISSTDPIPVTPLEPTSDAFKLADFGGNVSSVLQSGDATAPPDSHGAVLKINKASGSESWAGTSFATLNAAEFISTAHTTMSARVWAPATGIQFLMKLENATNKDQYVQSMATSTQPGWQTLTFDFTQPSGSPVFNDASLYNKASFFCDFDVREIADKLFYVDDISYSRSTDASGQITNVILNMEEFNTPTTTVDHQVQFLPFNGANVALDSTTGVFKFTKLANTAPATFFTDYGKYTGFQFSTKVDTTGSALPIVAPIPFTADNTSFGLWVHTDRAGTLVTLQVGSTLSNVPVVGVDAVTTVAGWQFLTFDFSHPNGAGLRSNTVYNQINLLFDAGAVKLVDTNYYFDKLVFGHNTPSKPADFAFSTVMPPTQAQTEAQYGGPPSFFDEFNAVALDITKWDYDLGKGPNNDGWGNGERQVYTNSVDNVFVQDGYLHIVAKQLADGTITSGRLISHNTVAPYGYAEIRAKLPTDVGTWPALWLLGQRDGTNWPTPGEIDIAEYSSKYWSDGNQIQAALHFRGNGDNNATFGNTGYKMITRVAGFTNDFHTYQLWWTPESIRIGVDGDKNAAYFYYITNSDLRPTDFGNATSTIISNGPVGAHGNVVQWAQTATSKGWAGSTLTTLNGAEFIDTTHQTVSIRVWAPAVGLDVKMKLENANDSTQHIEKDLQTTVVGWQTMTFDFSIPTSGTAAFNNANVYNKANIFLDFMETDSKIARTFYLDDFSYYRSGDNPGQITFTYDEFTDPAKFILNLAIGGSLGSDTNNLATGKQYEMLVDYVRYYRTVPVALATENVFLPVVDTSLLI